MADLLNDFKLPITVLNKQSQVHQDIFTSKQLILFFADFQNTKKVEEMRLNSWNGKKQLERYRNV